jgi:thymidylate kinase
MGNLICFIGLDGSGKTTMANITLETLQRRGIRCKTVWAKFGLTTLSNILGILKINRSITSCPANPYLPQLQSSLGMRLYVQYLLFEHWMRLLVNIRIPMMLGKTVICDRYYFDTIVDLVVTFGHTYEDAIRVVRSMPGLAKPDIVFYIRISPEKAIERKKDIYDITYLEKRYGVYSLLAQDMDLIVLDGNRSIENLGSEIVMRIASTF